VKLGEQPSPSLCVHGFRKETHAHKQKEIHCFPTSLSSFYYFEYNHRAMAAQILPLAQAKVVEAEHYVGPLVQPKLQNTMGQPAFIVLSNSNDLRLVQGRAFQEMFFCGAIPNIYQVADFNTMYQQVRGGKNWGEPVPLPVFFIEEKSADGCCSRDNCCRWNCEPHHPAFLKFYHATPPKPQDDLKCCCVTLYKRPDISHPMRELGAFMTLEKFGLCQRISGCFVCAECCQAEMRLHAGDVGDPNTDRPGYFREDTVVARSFVPIGGGGCTPTIMVMDRNNGQEIPAAVIEGPTCFGGMADYCCDTTFRISSRKGKSGDLGVIDKKVPRTCGDCCRAVCTPADTYDMHLTPQGRALPPHQKAALIGELVHLDYMFFENDKFPINCEKRGKKTYCNLTFCLCYLSGCLCPCTIRVPLGEDQ